MDRKKLLRTYEILDSYEKRFARATLEKPFYIPSTESERGTIIGKVKKMLGYDETIVPSISRVEEVFSTDRKSFTVTELRYMSWENVYGCASLYLPKSEGKLPLAFLACGHGDGGRAYYSYRRMAERLADMGIAVIVPDNIGQGDREFMGHKECFSPFFTGLSLQGLIVMEIIALIRYMAKDERFDKERVAALGNSGGGTLTMFLAALCPELSVIASSGYASEFHYIHSKEKIHCACNLLRGSVASIEPWEIYSVFAPKPLLLENGCFDNLFPVEYFERCARKVFSTYSLRGAAEDFEKHIAKTRHGWDDEDIEVICEFLARRLLKNGSARCNKTDTVNEFGEERHVSISKCALTVDELCEELTGKKMPEGTRLSDIFKPTLYGKEISEDEIIPELERGNTMDILAQMECALSEL